MAKLEEATSRLAAAVGRLEGVLNRPAAKATPRRQGDLFAADEAAGLRRQLAAITAERDKLRQDLTVAQEENGKLQSLATELSTGLDAAIGELKTVLDN